MFPHFSPAFQRFVAPAQKRSEIWRTILGFVLVFALFLLTTLHLGLGTAFLGEFIEPGLGESLIREVGEGRTIFATFAMLTLIATMIPSLWLILRFYTNARFAPFLVHRGKLTGVYGKGPRQLS